ncbi:hypothetical protein ACH4A8_28300 [Streptomyces vietnamensis]|uniref:hypothetical protein n=1 Tax=Streptomyces vietnamensis TaxID=362257 RepID=UPI00379F17C4
MPPKLHATLGALGVVPDPAVLARVLLLLGGDWGELPRIRRDARFDVDVSEAGEDALRGVLASWVSPSEGSLLVAWPADRVGVAMAAAQLAGAIGELWYPAVDDLVVVQERRSGQCLVVVLDHEERLTCTWLVV